jgi:hypothetical protein
MIPWLKQRDVALLGGDVPPSRRRRMSRVRPAPVHDFALVYLGVHIFDKLRSRSARRRRPSRKRWTSC